MAGRRAPSRTATVFAQTPAVADSQVQRALDVLSSAIAELQTRQHTAIAILSGRGTPEGVVSAPVGSLFARTDGEASLTFYVKESGTGSTGWVAK